MDDYVIFARTAVKFVSDADDWRPVSSVLAQLHFLIGAAAAAVLWVFADPIAVLLGVPNFVDYLRLFSLDIPIFCLAYAHRQILVGRGMYGVRAIASGARWMMRLAIIAVLVGYAKWSIEGAILGSMGASVIELIIARWFARPPLLQKSSFAPQRLFGYALPLFLFAMSLRLFDKLDLFMLKILGGTVSQAGVYGAAQNLAFVPGIFALSFSPLLLSTLNSTLRSGDLAAAKEIGTNSVRMVISVVTAVLTAADRPNLTAFLVAPMLPISALGYWLFVPGYEEMGACWVNAGTSGLGAIASLIALYKIWDVWVPLGTYVAQCNCLRGDLCAGRPVDYARSVFLAQAAGVERADFGFAGLFGRAGSKRAEICGGFSQRAEVGEVAARSVVANGGRSGFYDYSGL